MIKGGPDLREWMLAPEWDLVGGRLRFFAESLEKFGAFIRGEFAGFEHRDDFLPLGECPSVGGADTGATDVVSISIRITG